MISAVYNGKAEMTKVILEGVTVPAKTKGKIVEEEGHFYFVVNDKGLRDKIGRIPIDVDNDGIFIRTRGKVMVGTKFAIDSNGPGFELRIKDVEKTISISAGN